MIRFIDGPAAGIFLSLQRAPILLRAVKNGCAWDALDQLDDVPKPDESIFLYRLRGEAQWVHLDGRDPNTGKRWGRTEWTGEYLFEPQQPSDADLRGGWLAWCEANKERVLAKRAKETPCT